MLASTERTLSRSSASSCDSSRSMPEN
jgi:hypothetical protein